MTITHVLYSDKYYSSGLMVESSSPFLLSDHPQSHSDQGKNGCSEWTIARTI